MTGYIITKMSKNGYIITKTKMDTKFLKNQTEYNITKTNKK